MEHNPTFNPQKLFDAGLRTGQRMTLTPEQLDAALVEVAAIREKWNTFVFNRAALDRLEAILRGNHGKSAVHDG